MGEHTGDTSGAVTPERVEDLPLLASVAPPVPVGGLFDYQVPERLAEQVVPGVRAMVPFGGRSLSAPSAPPSCSSPSWPRCGMESFMRNRDFRYLCVKQCVAGFNNRVREVARRREGGREGGEE